ncbi:hypothetical protein HY493_03615 [Candidatus Woesearchaeota archaeon]|nr:hypothetical protein [Candidatus Woesearchaeota archaeon]
MKKHDSGAELDALIRHTCVRIRSAAGRNGLVRKIYFLDKRRWYEQYKPDDFGDHMPFLSVAEGNTTFAQGQWTLWKQRMVDGIPRPKHVIALPPMLYANAVDDMLQGMSVLHEWFGKTWLEDGLALARNAQHAFQMRSGVFATVSIPTIHVPLPEGCAPIRPAISGLRFFANAPTNGLLAASLLQFGSLAGDDGLLQAGTRCLNRWIGTRMFVNHGLFPYRLLPGESSDTNLMKANSNFAHALLDTMETGDGRYREAMQRLVLALRGTFRSDLGCSNEPRGVKVSLMATQAYCTILWRMSRLGYPELRDEAESIAWNVANAAFGDTPTSLWRDAAFEDDAVGDFLNLLMLMDEKRKNREIIGKAHRYLVDNFYLGDGLWQDYRDPRMQRTAHSKFLGGVLKHLLGYRAYLRGEDISHGRWSRLLEDR